MILYKYGGDSGLRILEDLRLKITPPIEFNDPFEITPNTKRARPPAEMARAAKIDSKYFRDVYDNMVRDGKYVGPFNQFIKDMAWAIPAYYSPYKKLSTSEMIKRDMHSLAEFSSHFGMLCLSTPPNNIPMWSYYGNQHRGIVFGIEIENISGRLLGWRGFVKYRKHRVKLNPFAPDGVALSQRERVLFTKSSEWIHEQEHRHVFRLSDLVAPRPGKNEAQRYFLDISGSSIKEVILGYRINPKLERKIRQALERRKHIFGHIRLLRCERHISKFELKIVSA